MKDNCFALLNEYAKELKLKDHRPYGVKTVILGVKKFFVYLEERNLTLMMTGINEALEYQGWLVATGRLDGRKYSANSINNFLVSVSSFFDYLKMRHRVPANPFKEIRRIRRELKLPRNILKEKEMGLLLKSLSDYMSESSLKNRISKYRVHVIAEVMYSTGLRIREIAGLRHEDIDFERSLLRVNEGKQGQSRICILNEYAKSVLKIYVEKMSPLVLTEWNVRSPRLFGSGDDCLIKLVNKVLARETEKLNLPKQTSHGFRHALGFHLLRRGCDIRYIQAILGHKSLTNTEIYTKVEKEDLKEILEQYHPRQLGRREHEEAHT